MRLFNLLYKIIKKINKPMKSMGNIYWNNRTWKCPADGLVIVKAICKGSYVLIYIANSKNEVVGSIYGEGNNGSFTTVIPVLQGEGYKTTYAVGYGEITANYIKLGGIS